MKVRLTTLLFALLCAAFLWLNNSSGPAAVQGLDRTGSPLSPAPCQACHAAGAFSPTFTLQLQEDGTAVSEYIPGQSYTLRVEISDSGASGYGFQAVALSGENDIQAGDFLNPPDGLQVTPLDDRQYAEHSRLNSENIFEIEWRAPEAGSGEVRFYSAVVAANANGSSGGDGSVFLAEPVVLSEGLTSSAESRKLFEAFTVFPNPVEDLVNLSFRNKTPGEYQLRLLSLRGRALLERRIEVGAGEQVQQLRLSSLPAGIYTLQVTDGQRVSSRRVVKW